MAGRGSPKTRRDTTNRTTTLSEMPDMGSTKRVLAIANMPCSSGTFYTSFIGKSLSKNSWIIDETSPNEPNSYGLKAFSLSIPLLKECLRGRIPLKAWESSYRDQVGEIFQHWKRSESDLLIFRGHAWTDANSPVDQTIADVLKSLGIDFETIYTHRNPADTWLGFNASFPESAKEHDLDSFARIYMKSVTQWSEANGSKETFHIRTEEIARDPQRSMRYLAQALDIPYNPHDATSVDEDELGTGASGRFFPTPVVPKRRPYSTRMIREAQRSRIFRELQTNLGYLPGLGDQGILELMASVVHTIYQPLLRLAPRPGLTVSIAASKLGLKIAYY